ncbi:MAG TPA: dispase autolysis-inducing protein [Thermoanaerobaculia bacterium]|nr:dispase autolysis-inducing protein [Thermoanaerobaculia bacterium]
MTRRLIVPILILAALPAAAARRRSVNLPPLHPPCTMILGSGAVAVTRNGGVSLIPSADIEHPISYTYGVTTMIDEPSTVVAWNKNDLLISKDHGCTWRIATTIEGSDFPPTLTAAPGGRVYAWSENRSFLVRYDSRGAQRLKQPADFLGFAVDAENGDHLRAGGSDGSLWESHDAGETWDPLGRLGNAPLYYRFIFDPNDLDHIVAGTVANGAFVSRDGGRNWTKATGFSKGDANVFQLVISPVDANVVWAMGIDTTQSSNPDDPSHGRHIYVSRDGGATYDPVIDEQPGVKLINGPTMAAHPTNANILYFVFGTHIFDYGTDLFRFDLANPGELVLMHHAMDGINAIAFSPEDPNVMYLGVETID